MSRVVLVQGTHYLEYSVRKAVNQPIDFDLVGEGVGADVEYVVPVFSPRSSDARFHLVLAELTARRLKMGWDFNAFRILATYQVAEHENLTLVQPVKV